MGLSLVMPSNIWESLRCHLLADWNEHLAFLLAAPAGERLLVQDIEIVPDDALENGGASDGLVLKLPYLLHVINLAHKRQLTLVEAHSHPFSRGNVTFSGIDLLGQQELVSYLSDPTLDRVYGALVLGQDAVQGNVWLPSGDEATQLDEIRVVGPIIERWPGNGECRQRIAPQSSPSSNHHRQELALGSAGQRSLLDSNVAIVGLGGIGSIVAQELAHLGVGSFTLIDDDVVETSNLSRLAGACEAHVGKPKATLASDVISKINPRASLNVICENVRSSASIDSLKASDVIFGCVDTDAGRMILNEFSVAYMIPYIDLGVGISVAEGRISEAGGRIVLWVPGRPCLLCCKEFRPDIAAEELEGPEERQFRRQHGYVSGLDVPEPAVMSLNGTVASLAVTEFLALTTGFRASGHYTYYDMLEQRVGPRVVHRKPDCIACAVEGLGDSANIERYGPIGLPKDIPHLDRR